MGKSSGPKRKSAIPPCAVGRVTTPAHQSQTRYDAPIFGASASDWLVCLPVRTANGVVIFRQPNLKPRYLFNLFLHQQFFSGSSRNSGQ